MSNQNINSEDITFNEILLPDIPVSGFPLICKLFDINLLSSLLNQV